MLDHANNIKIVDFGLSTFYQGKDSFNLQTKSGSLAYAAPEVILGKRYNGMAVDTWSCGVTLFVMLAGELPFDNANDRKIARSITNLEFNIPKTVSKQGKDLIKRILVKDPSYRICM